MRPSRLFAALALWAASLSVFALETELDWTFASTEVSVATAGAGTPSLSSYWRSVEQGSLQDSATIGKGLTVFGTIWASFDNLPSDSPLSAPSDIVQGSSRVLEGGVSWELLPGTLVFDVGKKIIHPSSGFFETPLDLMARPTDPFEGPAAISPWEEGWIGAGFTWLAEGFTLSDYLSPALTWSSAADSVLHYVTSQQGDWQDLVRLSSRIGDTDIQALGLCTVDDPLSSSAAWHLAGGLGADGQIGDALTLRAEAALHDSMTRITTDGSPSLGSETIDWVPRALAGLTWTISDKLNLMAEYGYDGSKWSGVDYENLLAYEKARGSDMPDPLNSGEAFDSAASYGFVRAAGDLGQSMNFDAWLKLNLQDASGIFGGSASLTKDRWVAELRLEQSFGGSGTEAAFTFFRFRLEGEFTVLL